jgi:hypothetical protein
VQVIVTHYFLVLDVTVSYSIALSASLASPSSATQIRFYYFTNPISRCWEDEATLRHTIMQLVGHTRLGWVRVEAADRRIKEGNKAAEEGNKAADKGKMAVEAAETEAAER